VWTLFHSYSFDFSVWEIFACYAHGGRLVVVADEVATDPRRFLDLLRRERVTVLNQTPTAFGQLTQLVLTDGEPAPADLRYVLFSGEATAPGKLACWPRLLPELRMVNMYGITETTVLTTTRVLTRADIDGDVGNIGRAMPTNATYLLDRHNPRRLLPVGAIGEIYVGGEGVAVGYLKRPELNAERFLPDPFTGGRMFKSGDLARHLPDGSLEYLGRGDFQIKLRGFRIEPGEIESCLRAHPDVADAVVLLDGGSEGRLVAYLRCPHGPPDPTALRAHLGGRLPVYMVPAEFHLVDEFARTGNGKLDRRALREQGVALSAGPRRAPHTPTGRLVASVYERLLPGTTPGADDSFFELGGHSILATRLVGELAAATGVRLSLRDLFLLPGVQDLADHLDSLSPGGIATLVSPDAGPEDTEALLWRIRGELSADALRAALRVDVRDVDAEGFAAAIDDATPGDVATVLRRGPDEHLVLVPARHPGADGGDGGDGLDHWADHLTGAPATFELCPPPSRPGPDGSVRVALPTDVAARTGELRADCRASWPMLAVAAVSAMLHRWSGSDDVTFGLPVAAHANLVVLRSRHKEGMSFADLLADVRSSMLDAEEFGGVPLPAVRDRLGSQPFRDVVVDAEPDGRPFGPATSTAASTAASTATITVAPARAPGLTVTVTDADIVLSYRGDRYAEADVRRMGDWLARLLHDVGPVADEPLEAVLPAAGARQYRDFALAQATRAEGEAGLAHWAHALAGAPAYPEVTAPRRATPPGEIAIELADDTLPRLREAMRAEHGVSSWFMVAATGLAALLHRWTGQADVTFGSPVANRQEFADVLGPCLNTVVLRSECGADTSVRDLLYAMRDRILAAFDHQWVPFDEIVHRLNPPRRAGWTPYLDVLLAVFTEDAPEAVLDGIELAPVALDHYGTVESGMFGLSVGLEEVDGRLAGAVRYRGDRYTEDDVRLMARWLGRFLESFADIAARPVHTLDLVDDAERAALTRFEHGPPAGAPTSVPALVARHSVQRPDAVAVRSGRDVLTYGELAARSASLAGALREHASCDVPVAAVVLPRGADLVVAMLGAWQAGLAVSVLDPACPATRIRSVVAGLGASVVVASDPSVVDGVPVVDARAAGSPVAGPVDPDATACVLYTAGTTGEPKPVAQRHSALASACEAGPVERSDRVSWLHPVASVHTQLDVWRALAAGAELVSYDGLDATPDQASEVAGWLAAHDVTVAAAPAPLAEAVWATEPALPATRWLTTGGVLTGAPPTGLRVHTTYGCAEALEVTRHELTADSPLAAVGRPAPGVRVAVLDAAGNRCPIGIPGEIHVGVATGATAATGDRGRWLADGTLEYLGRLAGPVQPDYRALLAVESYLRDDPSVAQAVVQHFPDEAVPLVAYAVARESADTRATLARLRLALPAPLVPGELMWLDRLPVNRRGKIDLDALPRPVRDGALPAEGGAPAAGMEQRIAAVWCAVLGLDSVGAHDNFFDLGGNSLLLARLHARLQAAVGTTLPIRTLFAHPTVHLLARALTAGPASTGESGASRDRGSQTRAALANRARPNR
jgi:non-ribosomal peptide synthetase component F